MDTGDQHGRPADQEDDARGDGCSRSEDDDAASEHKQGGHGDGADHGKDMAVLICIVVT